MEKPKPKSFLTAQAVYNKMREHLLKQMKKAEIEDIDGYGKRQMRCVYRTDEGLCCAVGGLINPNIPTEPFEGMTIAQLQDIKDRRIANTIATFLEEALEASGINTEDTETLTVLTAGQDLHDSYTPSHWEEGLNNLERAMKWKPAQQ